VADVLAQRVEHREGPQDLALRCGTSARTVSRILARAGMPRLWDLDPVTGARIRSSRASNRRYERDAPGDMIHIDVKKLGRIRDCGGWRADPAQSQANHRSSGKNLGFDYVHVAVDDYTRFAYAEVLPDEKGKGTRCSQGKSLLRDRSLRPARRRCEHYKRIDGVMPCFARLSIEFIG